MRFGKKSTFLIIIIALSSFCVANPAYAKKKVVHHHARKVHRHVRAGVDRSASYADIVMDAESGEILHATDPDRLRHPASLTKMMTLYLTFQAIDAGRLSLNEYLPVSENASEQQPSKLGLRPGQRIRAEDAIMGLVTESANDAAVVLGEWLGGSESEFATMMTKQAHALGMSKTHFSNPSGLPNDSQVTTARDMAVLGDALIYHFPQYYPYFSHNEFTYAGITHHNHNHLMDRYDGMDGIKTGYIRASGFNLVASAKRGSTRLIGVVFGGHSTLERDNRMAQLLDQAFDRAENGTKTAGGSANGAEGDADDDSNGVAGYVGLPAKAATARAAKPQPAKIVVASAKMQDANPNNWGVQIGAYSDPDVAQKVVSSLINGAPQILGNARPEIQRVAAAPPPNDTPLYRARLMGISRQSAEAVCASFIKQGQSCTTIAP